MKRRQFLQTSLAAASAGMIRAQGEDTDFPGILDSNVSLFHWPFRRLPLDETETLVAKLRSLDVTKALAGSFEGIFHRDLAAANGRLVDECARFPELVPIGSINPAMPDWERDLDRCAGEWAMPGIRLHPNVHGYALDDARFLALLRRAKEANLIVQLAVTLEDPRTQPARFATPDVDLSPLPGTMAKVPGARVQLLNLRPSGSQLETLASVPDLVFDTARLDATDGVASLLAATGPDRVLFGSHAPFLIPEASLIRVHESALDPGLLRSVLGDNAERLFALA